MHFQVVIWCHLSASPVGHYVDYSTSTEARGLLELYPNSHMLDDFLEDIPRIQSGILLFSLVTCPTLERSNVKTVIIVYNRLNSDTP